MVNYILIFIRPVGVGKLTLCNHIYQLLKEILAKLINEDDIKSFYSMKYKQCSNNYRISQQFKTFLSSNVSTFGINNDINYYESFVDSRYYDALDEQQTCIYNSRQIDENANNVMINDIIRKNIRHQLRRSSSVQLMNTFNEYTINEYTEFIQVRGLNECLLRLE